MKPFLKRCAWVVAALQLVLGAPGCLSQGTGSEPPPGNALFSRLIRARLRAFSRGDSAAYRALVGSDLVHTDDHGTRRTFRQVLAHVATNRAPDDTASSVRYDLSNVAVQLADPGNLAFVEATVNEGVRFGTRRVGGRWQETNVFAKRGARWCLILHAETPLAGRGAAAAPGDSAQLKDFAGRYAWWPGYEERITQRGGTLYEQDADTSPPWPFVQRSPDVFSPKNDSSTLMVFGRDATGRVTHYNLCAPGWPVIRAQKVR